MSHKSSKNSLLQIYSAPRGIRLLLFYIFAFSSILIVAALAWWSMERILSWFDPIPAIIEQHPNSLLIRHKGNPEDNVSLLLNGTPVVTYTVSPDNQVLFVVPMNTVESLGATEQISISVQMKGEPEGNPQIFALQTLTPTPISTPTPIPKPQFVDVLNMQPSEIEIGGTGAVGHIVQAQFDDGETFTTTVSNEGIWKLLIPRRDAGEYLVTISDTQTDTSAQNVSLIIPTSTPTPIPEPQLGVISSSSYALAPQPLSNLIIGYLEVGTTVEVLGVNERKTFFKIRISQGDILKLNPNTVDTDEDSLEVWINRFGIVLYGVETISEETTSE